MWSPKGTTLRVIRRPTLQVSQFLFPGQRSDTFLTDHVHRVSYVRQTEIHIAKPLVPEPSAFEVEMATEKLKQHKSPGTDRIPTEWIKAGGRTIHYRDH